MPVYSVSSDGRFALTLDFDRLHALRPGYGYCNNGAKAGDFSNDGTAIWRVSLDTGEVTELFSLSDFTEHDRKDAFSGPIHKVNHIMISPDNDKFMVLHRWISGGRRSTRLLVCDCDGGNMRTVLDDGFVSHCYWKDNDTIITFAEVSGRRGYYLIGPGRDDIRQLWPEMNGDGHPSYSVTGRVVTDSYPDRRRVSRIYVLDDQDETPCVVAKVFSPFRYDEEVRCDLHPRWNRAGDKICFDGSFEGKRGLYCIENIK